jgi:hypothetical protein
VDPRAVLEDREKRKSLPHRASNSEPSVVQPVASGFTDCTIPAPHKINVSFSYSFLQRYPISNRPTITWTWKTKQYRRSILKLQSPGICYTSATWKYSLSTYFIFHQRDMETFTTRTNFNEYFSRLLRKVHALYFRLASQLC